MFFITVLLPVDDVPAVQIGAGAGVVPPPAARHALELQLGTVLEVIVVISVFGGEPLVVVEIVLRIHGESIHRRALEETQTQAVLGLLVLHQHRVVLARLGHGVFVDQFDAQFVSRRAAGELVQVVVAQPVVAREGPESMLVFVPRAMEVHAAVDRDVLHHRPATLVHGAVDSDGHVSGFNEIQAVPCVPAGCQPQLVTIGGNL